MNGSLSHASVSPLVLPTRRALSEEEQTVTLCITYDHRASRRRDRSHVNRVPISEWARPGVMWSTIAAHHRAAGDTLHPGTRTRLGACGRQAYCLALMVTAEVPMVRRIDSLSDAERILRSVWGYSEFRHHQRRAVLAALQGRDCLAILPTGGGKSLCFQVPALGLPGVTLVVSPLISLMQDQRGGGASCGKFTVFRRFDGEVRVRLRR